MSAPDIEAHLAEAAGDAARIPEFLTALLDAQVLVPGVLASGADVPSSSPSVANLAPLNRSDGTSVQPFFTSKARLEETLQAMPGYESRYLQMRCRDLWGMTRGSTLILNPHSAYGKEFPPGEIGQLLDGAAAMTTHVLAESTTVLVGRPAETPPGLEEALCDLLRGHKTVESAYLGWKVVPSSGDQSYLVVIVGSPGARTAVSDELGRALVYYTQEHPVDVIFASPGEAHLLTDIEPFFLQRKRFRSHFRR